MGDSTSDSVYILYRAFHHDLVERAGAARVDVSEVQLLRWYGKRVDVRKPTLHFNEFRREAFLELAPHYYFYEDGKISHPAIVTPDMLPDPELTADAPLINPRGRSTYMSVSLSTLSHLFLVYITHIHLAISDTLKMHSLSLLRKCFSVPLRTHDMLQLQVSTPCIFIITFILLY